MRLTHLRIRYGRARAARSLAFGAAWAALPSAVATPVWRPPCDVLESGAGWIVRAEISGLAEDDFEVALYEDSLVVEGERPWTGAMADARVLLAELRYGRFRLELPLPGDLDRGAVHASYERGLLTVVLPRTSDGARDDA